MASTRFPRLAPVPVYLIVAGVGSAAFSMYAVISLVYQITEAGLNPLELILVGTVLEVSAFLSEIPTGVVADVYSRRLSLILGSFLVGAGFIIEGLFPVFGVILVAQVVWGVGATFRSGAQEAWIADEIPNEGVGRVYLRGSQVGQIGAIVGIVSGVALASGYIELTIPDLGVPLVVGGFLTILVGMFMAAAMPEEGFRGAPADERESWKAMTRTFSEGVRLVRRRTALIAILAIAVFYGASSEPIDRYFELHVLTITGFNLPPLAALNPVVWWGIISVAGLFLGIGATEVVRRYIDIDSSRIAVRALSWANAVAILSVVVFALAGNFGIAIAANLAYRVMRGIGGPIKQAWTNQQLESNVRATVFSMSAQADAFGQVASGPAIGVLATTTTVRAALLVVAALLVPPQAIYARVLGLRGKLDGSS